MVAAEQHRRWIISKKSSLQTLDIERSRPSTYGALILEPAFPAKSYPLTYQQKPSKRRLFQSLAQHTLYLFKDLPLSFHVL